MMGQSKWILSLLCKYHKQGEEQLKKKGFSERSIKALSLSVSHDMFFLCLLHRGPQAHCTVGSSGWSGGHEGETVFLGLYRSGK